MPSDTRIIQQSFPTFRISLGRKGFITKNIDFPSLFDMVREATRLSAEMGRGKGQYDTLELIAVNQEGLMVVLCEVVLPSMSAEKVDGYIITDPNL